MTADIKLLPLYPELQGHPKLEIIKHFARAVAEHNVAARDAEIERLKVVAHGFVDEIAARDAEIEALLCDARRYRWLREHGRYSGKVLVDHADMGRVLRIEKQLDEIIDAEMQRISAQEASND